MLNRVVLAGRLVRDPELRKVGATGNSVCSFTIAIDNWMKGPDGNRTTSFIPCVVWGTSADNVAKYARKGLLVGVDGRLVQHSYDRKDGTKASVIEVNADSVQFLEPKGAAGEASVRDEIAQPSVDDSKNLEQIDIPDDDLPF